MATKNIYISQEDELIFEKAKALSGGLPNSQLVICALKEFIANREKNMTEIEIKMGDEVIRFIGKKI